MAFDPYLALRVRQQMGDRSGLTQRNMFGGTGFMLHGNMCCGVLGTDLIVRVDPQQTAALLTEPGARPFDFTGRPMKGWLWVSGSVVEDDPSLANWVGRALAFTETLPPK